jgi:hypothetical protein
MAMFMTSSRDRVDGDWSCGDRYIQMNTPLGGLRPVTNPRSTWIRIDNLLIFIVASASSSSASLRGAREISVG